MKVFALKHHFSPSRLTNFARNHRNATPLMPPGLREWAVVFVSSRGYSNGQERKQEGNFGQLCRPTSLGLMSVASGSREAEIMMVFSSKQT